MLTEDPDLRSYPDGASSAAHYLKLIFDVQTIYASYTNILLITMLIAILSSSFDRVQKGATQELLFEKAVRTLERLKSDALLEYIPPANILAILL